MVLRTFVSVLGCYSGKVVGFITMPIKNNFEIYKHLFRFAVTAKILAG